MMSTSRLSMPIGSPHREREDSESICESPPASPTSPISIASLQEARLREGEDLGRYSPRASVAGRLGQLALHGDLSSSFPPLNASLLQESFVNSLRAKCWVEPSGLLNEMAEHISLESSDYTLNAPPEGSNNRSNTEPTAAPASPTKKISLASPRKRKSTSASSKMRQKRSSPPPSGALEANPYTWHDSEITGHNPTDPNDDGYGINGIGFKPTATIAWARSQKRQKQVAEWKTREAREAREKRREKRDGVGVDKIRSIQGGAIQKKVKFNL